MPRVGIFWEVTGKILIDSTPVEDAEDYGDCKTYGRSHHEYWDHLVRTKVVPHGDYEEHPRGRVVYNTKTRQYTIYADKCILRQKAAIKQIMREMHLPSKQTVTDTDYHYQCFRCLHLTASS